MRYLIKFNEALEPDKELVTFCEENLSYLLDTEFSLRIDEYSNRSEINIKSISKDGVNWEDMKDDFIPFFELLNSKYEIVDDIWFNYNGGLIAFSKEDVIDDNDSYFKDKDGYFSITQIKIKIKK